MLILEEKRVWEIYVDGSFNSRGSGLGVIIIDLEKVKLCYTLQFGFKDKNNKAEYGAITAGLRMLKALWVKRVHIKSDYQLVVSQISTKYQAKGENTKEYLRKIRELMSYFLEVKKKRVSRIENYEVNNLA